jgi:hypothetical protein
VWTRTEISIVSNNLETELESKAGKCLGGGPDNDFTLAQEGLTITWADEVSLAALAT